MEKSASLQKDLEDFCWSTLRWLQKLFFTYSYKKLFISRW